MNKYGYFKYSDFALGAKENASYSINKELQEGSALTQLRVGVKPYDFVSLEENAYITSQPKKYYTLQQDLGLLTAETSNENGVFADPVVLTVNFPLYFSMTGITINSRNIIKKITISAYQNDTEVAKQTFSSASSDNFYPINIELANKIVFTIEEIDKPHHFFGIYNIEYGKIRLFNDETSINAEITNNFSVLGDTLEYDTLDLTVIDPEKEDYLFQRKQPIDFVVDDEQKARFYVDSGTELDDNTVQLLAYDEIASLEDDFLGGMYENYPFNTLIADILSGTNINFETENTENIVLSGYLPITSRRKALQTVLQGSNIRCYKGDKIVFKPLITQISDTILDETNIINKPQKNKKQELRSLVVKKHNYSKGAEETELYHWYVSTTENVRITFSSPMHSLKAYEVIGVDENDQDIISETESENVRFLQTGANYCVISNTSSNKIVIVGLNYVDSTVDYVKENPFTATNEVYEEKVVDLTISSNPQDVCNLLYDLYSRKNSIKFNTFVDVEMGGCYSILGEVLNIKSKYQTLNGIYEVEAV
jgi:hypothetical protein